MERANFFAITIEKYQIMSIQKVQKNDPYSALRYKEFNIFLLLRFAMVFGW